MPSLNDDENPIEPNESPGPEDVGGKRAFPVEFSTNVPAGTTRSDPVQTVREAPYDGRIITVIIGWPDGTGNGVGVRFRNSTGEDYIPRNPEDQYIAANDFTHPFTVRADVKEEEDLYAEFINNDDSNDHFVNVFATIVENE